jgi:hypothetical protein
MKNNNPIDGNSEELNEGDRVFTYEYTFTPANSRTFGTLHKNIEYPEVSEWYVKYDDGEECAVLDFRFIFKTLK